MARGTGQKRGHGRGHGTPSRGSSKPTDTSCTGLKITIPLFSTLRSGIPANPAPLDNGGASVPVRNVSAPAYNPPSTPQQVETHSWNEPLLSNEPLPSTPTREGEEETVITPPPLPTKEAVRRAIEEVLGGRLDEDEDEEISIEDLEEGEDEDAEDDDGEDEVEIVEKRHSSKKAWKRGGDDAPPLLETSIEPSKSEYPFQS